MQELPINTIVMYSGTTIPSGWLLCDGRNGTPDLTNRFVLGTPSLDNIGKTNKTTLSGDNGNLYFTAKSSSVAVHLSGKTNNHTLTEEQIPSHHHTGGFALENSGFSVFGGTHDSSHHVKWSHFSGQGDSNSYFAYTDNIGGGQGHSHDFNVNSESHSHDINISPPYYILAFIIYKGNTSEV